MAEAPGWYPAEGDPAGTCRYWDGAQWVGAPVARRVVSAPSLTQRDYPPPSGYSAPVGHVPSTLHGSVVPLAVILTVMKVLPLLVAVAGSFSIVGDALDGDRGTWSDLSTLAVTAIGVLLLVSQLVGVFREKPFMLIAPAVIMTVFDLWLGWVFLGPLGSSDAVGSLVIFVSIVALMQGTVAFHAARAMQRR